MYMVISVLGSKVRIEIILLCFVVGIFIGVSTLCSCAGGLKEGFAAGKTIMGSNLGYNIGDGVQGSFSKVSPLATYDSYFSSLDGNMQGLAVPLQNGEMAIFSENKTERFYFVKEDSIPKLGKHWASGIGSFSKQHILNHKSKRFKVEESDIETIEINFINFETLINKYEIKSIDKLQIDVEGAEFDILNSIDFNKIIVKNILFESKHFDGTFTEGKKLKIIKEKLILNGYKLFQLDEENILAKKLPLV